MKAFVICTTPRSGSYLLCDYLDNTGLVGKPAEYLTTQSIRYYMHEWGIESFSEYLDRFLELASRGAPVSGLKLMANLWPGTARDIAETRRWGGLAPADALARLFPQARFIFLRRRNELQQAISLFMAQNTGLWAIREPKDEQLAASLAPPSFSFRRIHDNLCMIRESNAAWKTFFRHTNITPLSLHFEDFLADKETTLRDLLAFVGAEVPDDLAIRTTMKKQSSAISKQFLQKYRRRKPLRHPLLSARRRLRRIARRQKDLSDVFTAPPD